MVADARRTLRNAGLLAGQRVLHVAGAAAFAVMVPRLLGPTQFGRYALLQSVSMWFALLSGLGAVSMMTRSVPRFVAAGDLDGLRRFATSLVALRSVTGTMSAAGFFLVLTVLIGEPDPVCAALIAGAVFSRTIGNMSFALFLGLNDAARWGMGELVRRWMTLLFVPAAFLTMGFRGACLGVLAAEAGTLALGLWWARPYLGRAFLDLSRRHLAPFLRVGSVFAAGNLLLALTQRSGETIVRLSTGSYDEVGFFGAAYAINLTVAHALWQIVVALAPYLIVQIERGRRDVVAQWLERLLKYFVAIATLSVAGAVFLGRDAVPLVLGRQYAAVAANVVPLTLTLLAHAFGSVARLLALALDRPRVIFVAAALELVAFWAVGLPLANRLGSFGACVAALPASAVYALYLTAAVRPELPYRLGAAARALAAGSVFLPLAFLRGPWELNIALFGAGAAAYVGLLLKLRVVTFGEVGELRRLLEGERVRPPVSA